MPAFTVHEPGDVSAPLERADRIALVKEGFSWPALLFSVAWLAYHRMWLVLIAFVLAFGALQAALVALSAGPVLVTWLTVAFLVLFAFFANDLRRWTLARRRYRMVSAVAGRSANECEQRFFADWLQTAAGEGSPQEAASNPPAGAAAAVAEPAPKPLRGLFRRPPRAVIIDYGSGNLHSAAKAFERAAREAGSSLAVAVSAAPDEVARAERIVLPGVGAFVDCMNGLKHIPGMIEALEDAVRRKGRPFLGICVGMQLMATRGLEHVETPGLDWIRGEVRPIAPADPALKVPHMGWNTLEMLRAHPLLDGLRLGPEGQHAYFVHSYHLVADDRSDIVAETDYGGPVTAVVARDNLAGTQFHPEKSQKLGLALIANFLKWSP